jgi:hypothetical protein
MNRLLKSGGAPPHSKTLGNMPPQKAKELASCLASSRLLFDERHSWAVGPYLIIPDHVHFFCRPELGAPRLSEFIGAGKVGRVARSRVGWAAISDRGYSTVATRVL